MKKLIWEYTACERLKSPEIKLIGEHLNHCDATSELLSLIIKKWWLTWSFDMSVAMTTLSLRSSRRARGGQPNPRWSLPQTWIEFLFKSADEKLNYSVLFKNVRLPDFQALSDLFFFFFLTPSSELLLRALIAFPLTKQHTYERSNDTKGKRCKNIFTLTFKLRQNVRGTSGIKSWYRVLSYWPGLGGR